MNFTKRLSAVTVLACVAALTVSAVASAKIITKPLALPGSSITVNITGKKGQQKISLLDLKYICPTGFGQINSPRIAGIGRAKISKKGKFVLKKSGVKIINPDTNKAWGKGGFAVKGKLVRGRLTGKVTVKHAECGLIGGKIAQ
ncbi:MAG: hypothetical protein M9938_06485 [Solirubrobacterales bacterium]|nr:hypothetical protein [Solirubrobacterales bacterium]